MKYNVKIYFTDDTELNLNLEYEKVYDMQAVVSSYGKNGVWEVLDDTQIYHPAHKVNKIKVIKK